MCTSDKLEKRVYSVVLCVQYVEICTERRAFAAESINFCFHLKKTVAESYRLFREAYGEHVPSQDTCVRWFQRFKSGDFEIADKEHRNRQKILKMWNCKHCWTKMIRKHKNNYPSILALVNKLFPIDYERWEKLRRAVDGYYTT